MTMKTTLILLCLAAGLTTAPLLKAEPQTTTTTTVTSGTWTEVPKDYDGDYYFYNKQYYHGGKHETGDFEWEGKHYKDRYEHEGKWIYGGEWKHHDRIRVERDK